MGILSLLQVLRMCPTESLIKVFPVPAGPIVYGIVSVLRHLSIRFGSISSGDIVYLVFDDSLLT